MSETANVVAPVDPAPTITPNVPVRSAELDRLQAEKAELVKQANEGAQREQQLRAQLAEVQRTGETLRGTIAQLEPRAKQADELQLKVTGYEQLQREGAVLDELQPLAPGGSRLMLKGTLSALHEAGKANRYAPDAKAEATKIAELLKVEAPQLLRPLTTGGGSSGPTPTSTTPTNPNPKPKKTGLL